MIYNICIETNENSIGVARRKTRTEAIKFATSLRRTGGAWAGDFSRSESPFVVVHNETADKNIYCKPLCKQALKK